MNFIHIDVSELAPPEPMMKILSALASFGDPLLIENKLTENMSTSVKMRSALAQCLVVKHRRQPFPLYEKLTATGWAYHCEVRGDDDVLLYIYRQSAQQMFEHFLQQGT